jgi:hypothetical protein
MVGEHSYFLDIEAGKIRINEDVEFPIQVLGTESDNTLSWLWAWADEQAEVPVDLLAAALQVKKWGEEKGVPELTVPSVDLDRADGHVFAMIAAEICKASCYYRDAYEGGAAFFLIADRRIDAQPSFDLSRLSRRFLDLIARYDFNHRNALISYHRTKGLTLSEAGPLVTAVLETGESLSARFDSAGRLLSLNEESFN